MQNSSAPSPRLALVRRSASPPWSSDAASLTFAPFRLALAGMELASDIALLCTLGAVRDFAVAGRVALGVSRHATSSFFGLPHDVVDDTQASDAQASVDAQASADAQISDVAQVDNVQISDDAQVDDVYAIHDARTGDAVQTVDTPQSERGGASNARVPEAPSSDSSASPLRKHRKRRR